MLWFYVFYSISLRTSLEGVQRTSSECQERSMNKATKQAALLILSTWCNKIQLQRWLDCKGTDGTNGLGHWGLDSWMCCQVTGTTGAVWITGAWCWEYMGSWPPAASIFLYTLLPGCPEARSFPLPYPSTIMFLPWSRLPRIETSTTVINILP